MITPEEEAYILEKAYVPEHIINLMGPISKGEPFLKEDHLGFVKDNWLIFVGYPLDGEFSQVEKRESVETGSSKHSDRRSSGSSGLRFPLLF